jgi:hypothetical protein
MKTGMNALETKAYAEEQKESGYRKPSQDIK